MLSKLSQKSILNAFSTSNMLAMQAMQQKACMVDMSKASFFNVLKNSQVQSRQRSHSQVKTSQSLFGLDANRFFSSSSDSDAESSGSDVEEQASNPREFRGASNHNDRGNQNYSSTQPDQVIATFSQVIDQKAPMMTNSEFFLFLSQANRAISLSQDTAAENKEGIIQVKNEVLRRLMDDKVPTELDVIANFTSLLQRVRFYDLHNEVSSVLANKCFEVFGKPVQEIEPRFEQVSFLKLTQIFQALDKRQIAEDVVLRRINTKIQDTNEPTPVISIMRVLNKLTRNDDNWVKNSRTLDLIAFHFERDMNMQMTQLETTTRARLLAIYARHAENGYPKSRLISALLKSLEDDLASLQERSVIDMMQSFVHLEGTNRSREANKVAVQLHKLVDEMAKRNAELVDIQFLISYLSRFVNIRVLSRDKENRSMVELLKSKFEDPELAAKFSREIRNTIMPFEVGRRLNVRNLEDTLITRFLSGHQKVVNFTDLQNLNVAVKRKYMKYDKHGKGSLEVTDEMNQTYDTIAEMVQEHNATRPMSRFLNLIALNVMPKTDTVNSIIASELELYKQDAAIMGQGRLMTEVESLSKILRDRRLNDADGIKEALEVFCEANLNDESLTRFNRENTSRLQLMLLGSQNQENKPHIPEAFAEPLQKLNRKMTEDDFWGNRNNIQRYLQRAEVTHNERVRQGSGDSYDYVFLNSIVKNLRDNVDVSNPEQIAGLQISKIITKMCQQPTNIRGQEIVSGKIAKGNAFKLLDEMGPLFTNVEQRGFNRLVNDATFMKTTFNRIPGCYQRQIDEILENYETCTMSERNQMDYARLVLAIGEGTLNEAQQEVFRRYAQNDFNPDALDRLNKIQLVRLYNLAYNACKNDEGSRISREDVMEAMNDALDDLVGDHRHEIRKKNGSCMRALDGLNGLPNDILKDAEEKLNEVITQLFSEMAPSRSTREIRDLVRIDRQQKKNRPLLNRILNIYQRNQRADIESVAMGISDFNALFRVYAERGWKGMDCYNSFIKGFGEQFDKFEVEQLIDFAVGLERAGLNQKDIVNTISERVQELQKQNEIKGLKHVQLKSSALPLLQAALNLDLQDDDIIRALFTDEYAKEVYDTDSMKDLLGETQVYKKDAVELLHAAFARGAVLEDDSLKMITGVMVDHVRSMTERDYERLAMPQKKKLYLVNKYLQLNGKKVFGDEFEFTMPVEDVVVQNDLFRQQKEESPFAKRNEFRGVFEDMGYSDIQTKEYVEGIPNAYYLSEEKTLVQIIRNDSTLFDGSTKRADMSMLDTLAGLSGEGYKNVVLEQDSFRRMNREQCSDLFEKFGIKRLNAKGGSSAGSFISEASAEEEVKTPAEEEVKTPE